MDKTWRYIVTFLLTFVIGYIGSALGYELLNWPEAGPVLAVAYMGVSILRAIDKK